METAQVKRALDELRNDLMVSEGDLVYVSVVSNGPLAIIMHLPAKEEKLIRASDPTTLIYVREILDIRDVAWLKAQATITKANLEQLPTEALQREARRLLGLDRVEEVAS